MLLVEDDGDLAEVWSELLEMLGHEIRHAQDLASLDGIALSEVELAVIDWTLPDGSGSVALHRVRAANPAVKVVITTGHDEGTVPEGLDGADRVLRKPFRVRALRQVIAELT